MDVAGYLPQEWLFYLAAGAGGVAFGLCLAVLFNLMFSRKEQSEPGKKFISKPQKSQRRLSEVFADSMLLASFAVFLAAAALALYVYMSPWPVAQSLRHLGAMPSCTAARAVGLAPAARGQPGYWPSHDADQDGIACEPNP
jgi:uncharacterized membrane protein